MSRLKLTALCGIVVVLIGCGANEKHIRASIDSGKSRVEAELEKMKPVAKAQRPAFSRVSSAWIADPDKTIVRETPLPAVLLEEVIFSSAIKRSLSEIGARISAISGMKVILGPDVSSSPSAAKGKEAADSSEAGQAKTAYIYKGTLAGFLDKITAKHKLFWTVSENKILIKRYERRIFTLNVFPGTIGQSAKLGGSIEAGDGSVSDQGSQTTTMAVSLSMWAQYVQTIKAMLSAGGKLEDSESTGIVVVMDVPVVMDEIAAYIERENQSLSRELSIDIKVLAVNYDERTIEAFSWNPLDYAKAALNKPVAAVEAVVAVAEAVTESGDATGETKSAASTVTRKNKIDTAELMIENMSQVSEVQTLISTTVTTLNHQVTPIDVARINAFLKEVTISVTETGTTTSITPGQIKSGISMSLLPRMMSDGRLMVQYMTKFSVLLGFNEVKSGKQTIQTPEYDIRSFLSRFIVNSGETISLIGFDQQDTDLRRKGLAGDVNNWLMGGHTKANTRRHMLVVLITPTYL